MLKKIEQGFTLVEVIITSVIIVFISGAIYYGMTSINYSIRNAELNQKAFIVLSNKMEQLKAEVALGHTNGETADKPICIEYNTIRDMVNFSDSEGSGVNSSGCKTRASFRYEIRQRKTESLNVKICDINTWITWKMATRYGNTGRDTTLALSTTQMVFN